mmetsp:Transcript_6861/g.19984  ORF Transcript_6861/g.19984 Transcript_6861/m.19984 type:complete len:137 (-) Transcript_6861:893-1303(-)
MESRRGASGAQVGTELGLGAAATGATAVDTPAPVSARPPLSLSAAVKGQGQHKAPPPPQHKCSVCRFDAVDVGLGLCTFCGKGSCRACVIVCSVCSERYCKLCSTKRYGGFGEVDVCIGCDQDERAAADAESRMDI